MDTDRFDALVRSLSVAAPRRVALSGVLSVGLVAMLGGHGAEVVAAKKKRRKKKKQCKGGTKKCGGKCIPRASCCSNANCGSGADCVDGACFCLSGFKDCEDACIPEDACCTNDDCPPDATCEDGACNCDVAGQVACGEICTDLATDGANCGACDIDCGTDTCINGACTCASVDDCPFTGCACSARKVGDAACSKGPAVSPACANDDICPLGSFCTIVGLCSSPCVD